MENQDDKVLDQIADLFCRYGVKSVSMDDIARELGISKKTIYQQVRDKEELIERAIDRVKFRHMEQIAYIADQGLNAIEEVFSTMRQVRESISNINPVIDFEMRKYYPGLHRKLSERHSAFAQQIMKRNLQKGIDEGLFRDNFNIDFITLLHYGRVMDLIGMDEAELPVSWPEAIEQALEYHLRGICTPKGLDVLSDNLQKLQQQSTVNEN